jgi:hypothetical protein
MKIKDDLKRRLDPHGRYYAAAVAERMFIASTLTAGIALIVAATTGNHPTLWNPSDSGVLLEIVELELSWISGVNAPGALYWHETANAQEHAAALHPILTFTEVAAVNALRGSAVTSKAKWAPAVNTYTAAPAYLMPTGISLNTMAAASANAPFILSKRYDGKLVLKPGVALSLCSQMNTTTALFGVNVWYIETPMA